jgi:DNA-binding response OmpR family regulator
MSKHKILLVEDEYKLSQHIYSELVSHQYECDVAYDGIVARKLLSQEKYDLILLDINIPGVNGLELCREIHANQAGLPIIMMTALGDIDTKLQAYEYGAQDYLVKPIHLKELLAKVNVFSQRFGNRPSSPDIRLGELVIVTDEKKVFRRDTLIDLTPKEFDILHYLAKSPKRVISKNELSSNVWSDQYIVSVNTIEVYISFLRNKLDKGFDQKLILTKHGFGYYLNPEVCH